MKVVMIGDVIIGSHSCCILQTKNWRHQSTSFVKEVYVMKFQKQSMSQIRKTKREF